MSINIQAKTDTSYLFSNLSSSQSGSFNSMSWLKDYGLVKSGAYSKLMKAYYSESDEKKETVSKVTSAKNPVSSKNTTADAYNKVSEAASSVQKSIKNIQEAAEEDTELLVSAVKNYVKSFNSMMKAASDDDINDSSISSRIAVLSSLHSGYSEKLNPVGISLNKDGNLDLDEDKLKSADAKDIKNLFAERSSYGYSVGVSAEMVQSNANYAATRSSLYNEAGTAVSGSYGYLFDTMT